MVTTHVFIAVSLDGYIARQDDDIDWLLQRDDPTEDHGYAAFIADKDWIVMGRGSYEKALTVVPARRAGRRYDYHYRSCPARFGKTAVRFPDQGYRFDSVIKP